MSDPNAGCFSLGDRFWGGEQIGAQETKKQVFFRDKFYPFIYFLKGSCTLLQLEELLNLGILTHFLFTILLFDVAKASTH